MIFFVSFRTAPKRTPKDYNKNSHSYIRSLKGWKRR